MKHAARGPPVQLEPPLDFLQHLWELNHALERVSLQMERTLGVTAQQRLLLRCLSQHPGLSASELSEVLHVDRATVSVSLKRLERKGQLARQPDPTDGRRHSLTLTALGKKLVQRHPATVEHAVEALLAHVGERQVKQTKALLRRLALLLTDRLDETKARRTSRREH